MTTHTIDTAATTLDTKPAEDRVSDAALHLYEADFALHIARQSGIDAWVAAACDRLHEAVLAYDAPDVTTRPRSAGQHLHRATRNCVIIVGTVDCSGIPI
jgi:hypothetical protein